MTPDDMVGGYQVFRDTCYYIFRADLNLRSLALMMVTILSSEALTFTYTTTKCDIPEDRPLGGKDSVALL
jgi:hypothetical protein